ncbi:DUF402 domain-containing protein [Nocardia lijiangensis]|uniref:DUF402 domain-containing protein n=1 Tax=Nocardia lijiangensis TaxID=299618 RepID=UPI000A003DF8|nr:DUF402 domain-containing protein [Nocardia lijiangensis]
MSTLLPLFVAAPAVTGIAGYLARDLRAAVPSATPAATAAPPPGTPPHRPRVEYFNIAELTVTDAKGFVRPVERFQVEPWGLYMARMVDGSRYLQSWLLPDLSVRATVIHTRAGQHRSRDYVLDIGEYTKIAPRRWKAVDQYLDVVVRHRRSTQLRGVGELLAAHAAGLVDTAQAHRAVERATAALDGLAAHDHDVELWLAARDITLTWM